MAIPLTGCRWSHQYACYFDKPACDSLELLLVRLCTKSPNFPVIGIVRNRIAAHQEAQSTNRPRFKTDRSTPNWRRYIPARVMTVRSNQRFKVDGHARGRSRRRLECN